MVRQLSILKRMMEPNVGGFSTELANYILDLHFTKAEQARYRLLSAKVQKGALSADEETELDLLLSMNSFLTILKSKARVSLKKRPSAA